MTNKESIGKMLLKMRGDRKVYGLSDYLIKTIEAGSSSYSLTSLLSYCQSLSIQLLITDTTTDEDYPITSGDDAHKVFQKLMQRWHIHNIDIYRKTGVYYIPPTGRVKSFSIKAMLATLGVLHCKLKFIQK